MQQKRKNTLGIIIALLFFGINLNPQVQSISNLPNNISLISGETKKIEENLTTQSAFAGNGHAAMTIQSRQELLETEQSAVKQTAVETTAPKKLMVGGQAIGVKLHTKGALIVGISEFSTPQGAAANPATEAGIKTGDIIDKVNDVTVENSDHLSQLINKYASSGKIKLTIIRGKDTINVDITPQKDISDGKYKLGVWVRDSTAGVGTLTFYDPKTLKYASLGHAITDIDTKTNLCVGNGQIVISKIIDIKKGERGTPGELKGYFSDNDAAVGSIEKNTDFGIYGVLYKTLANPVYPDPLEIGNMNEVKLGKATILCTIDSGGINEYECEIVKINLQNDPSPKGMIVKITDSRLLNATGGIVQGMSGSPIIQNGKIIGAVTHVFINDPTQGYGMFIEWMLGQI